MKKKELRNITVTTLPNGYALQYDGQYKDGYMYYNAESLVAGMLKHIVLDDNSEQDPTFCRNLMQSMMTWPDTSELHTANAKLLAEIEDARKAAIKAQKQQSTMSKNYYKKDSELRDLKEKMSSVITRLENYEREKAKAEREAERARRKQYRLDIEAERKARMVKVLPDLDDEDDITLRRKRDRAAKARAAKAAKKAALDAGKTTVAKQTSEAAKPVEKTTEKAKEKPKAKAVEYSPKVYKTLMTPITIDALRGISLRTLKLLKYACGNINYTVGDVAKYSKKEILAQHGWGTVALKEWEDWLEDHGLQMGMNVTAILKQHPNGES